MRRVYGQPQKDSCNVHVFLLAPISTTHQQRLRRPYRSCDKKFVPIEHLPLGYTSTQGRNQCTCGMGCGRLDLEGLGFRISDASAERELCRIYVSGRKDACWHQEMPRSCSCPWHSPTSCCPHAGVCAWSPLSTSSG